MKQLWIGGLLCTALSISGLSVRAQDQRFEQLDRNNDGQLTRQELSQQRGFSQRRPTQPAEFVYIWVSDADAGHLTMNELQRAYDTLQQIDKDGDGELTRSELQACRKSNVDKWARTITQRLDDNDDGNISQREAEGTFLAARFDHVDSDGDGVITRQELQQCILHQHEQDDSQTPATRTRSEEDGGSDQDEPF